ncbi:MAG: proton-conducting transporter membrane subunit [Bacillota bacterium]
MTQALLPILIVLPFLAAGINLYIMQRDETMGKKFACGVTALIFSLTLVVLYENTDEIYTIPHLFSLGISLTGHSMQGVLAMLAAFVWLMTTLFSVEYFNHGHKLSRYYFFLLMTLGATLGVFYSADMFTTFVFFEMMSMTSYFMVIHEETEQAKRAANIYLTVAVVGGLVTLFGLFAMYSKVGSLDIATVSKAVAAATGAEKNDYYKIGSAILFGFAAKAGVVPMHIWLPEAHPVAPAPASGILSCILTKTGVFGMITLACNVFLHDSIWGNMIFVLGTVTMFLGAVLAVLSVDLKRTLACSSLSQIGFITVAIGMQGILGSHNALAAAGTTLHIVNHALLKLTLFLCAGVIYLGTHHLNLNDIRGYGKNKPFLKMVFAVAALGMAGMPLFSGYVSKTLIHESIVEEIVHLQAYGKTTFFYETVEEIFMISGGLTVAYMMKLYSAIFRQNPPVPVGEFDFQVFQKQKNVSWRTYMSPLTHKVFMVLLILLICLGLFPHQFGAFFVNHSNDFMNAHTSDHAVVYLAWVNVKGAVLSFSIGIFVYYAIVRTCLIQYIKEVGQKKYRKYVNRIPEGVSLVDWIYKPILMQILPFILAVFARFFSVLTDGMIALLRMGIFNDDNGRVVPKEDRYFSSYKTDDEEEEIMTKESYTARFESNLVYIAVGVAAVLLYIFI